MQILCRLGHHLPERRWGLDIADLRVKSRCQYCGAIVTSRGTAANPRHRNLLSRQRALPAFALLALSLIGAATIFVEASKERPRASVTVELPPAHAAAARPGFTLD
ncbi:MAG: hypothetical protein ACM3ZV_02105 [Bacillota bacterium]